MHFGNLYAALCRCAGIKARFKSFEAYITPIMQSNFFELNPQGANIGDAMGRANTISEFEVEVLIDGTWVTAYTPKTNILTAGTGWPITEFGESGIDLYFDVVPGSIHRYEAIPFGVGMRFTLMPIVAPAVMERVNARMALAHRKGLQELEKYGGVEGYNRMARKKREMFDVEDLIAERIREGHPSIVIKEPG